jgi:hypothetical protein
MTDKEMIVKLQTQVESLERAWCALTNDIKDIKDNLLRRPSWGVLVIITFLTSISGVLLALTLKK